MYYCSGCAKQRGWPESFFKTTAVCGSCKNEKFCNQAKPEDLSRNNGKGGKGRKYRQSSNKRRKTTKA